MNDDYILEKLKKWVPLFYGIKNEGYAIAYKKGDYYYFGYENEGDFVINKISKSVAIFLALGDNSFALFLEKIKTKDNENHHTKNKRKRRR